MKRAFLALVLLVPAFGCHCLDELKLRPELSVSDLARARAGTGAVEVTWKFKNCCPTSAQEQIALELQRNVAALWDRLLSDQVTLDKYNEMVRAAHDALTSVILVCAATPPQDENNRSVREAWARCDAVSGQVGATVQQ